VNIANIAKHYIQLNFKKGVSRKKNLQSRESTWFLKMCILELIVKIDNFGFSTNLSRGCLSAR